MKTKFIFIYALVLGLFLISSCRRKNDNPMWNMEVLAPLVKTSMSMKDIVKDTSFIKKNPDHSITLISRQELAKITLSNLDH